MRNAVLSLAWLGLGLLISTGSVRAGSIVFLDDTSPELKGKITATASGISAPDSNKPNIDFSNVLEAVFSDTPFHLDEFVSTSGLNKLPDDWKNQNLGDLKILGSTTVKDGVFILTSGGSDLHEGEIRYFTGRPWTGNGQFTIHIRAPETEKDKGVQIGLMARDNLTTLAPCLGLSAEGIEKGLYVYTGKEKNFGWGGDFGLDVPVWLRLTRFGTGFTGSVSTDGKSWGNCGFYNTQVDMNCFVGLFISSNNQVVEGKGQIDQVSFTPPPGENEALPSGVMLTSGSFVTGGLDPLDFQPGDTDPKGFFRHGDQRMEINASQVGFEVLQYTPRSTFAGIGSDSGILMRNGDFLGGTFEAINLGGLRLSSIALGVVSYQYSSDVAVAVVNPLKPQDAPYEVRLTDGSIIRASGFAVDNGKLVITEVSGLPIQVTPEELAQIRAGTQFTQNLLDVPWKATPPPGKGAPASAPVPAAAGKEASAPAAVPVAGGKAAAAAPAGTDIHTWTGPSQQEILVLPAGAKVDFPLKDKYRAIALRIALGPNAPNAADGIVRFLGDGRELGRTPVFRADTPPTFMQISVPPGTGTFTIETMSTQAQTRILVIDPTALKEKT